MADASSAILPAGRDSDSSAEGREVPAEDLESEEVVEDATALALVVADEPSDKLLYVQGDAVPSEFVLAFDEPEIDFS